MLKLQTTIILTFTFAVTILSCERIKRKGHQITDETKETIKEKKDILANKIIARFDATTPDTKFNKQRFLEFFDFYPTHDVKNLYCYADQMGIDASYWFSFECDDSTVQKIVTKLELRPDNNYIKVYDTKGTLIDSMPDTGSRFYGGLNSYPAFWWDTVFIDKSIPYGKKRDNLYWYLWHDKKNKKVYYLTFDT